MGKLPLTDTPAPAGRTRTACAAAVVAALAVAAATPGCAEQFDYVKPSATTATAGQPSGPAPQQADPPPGVGAGAAPTRE